MHSQLLGTAPTRSAKFWGIRKQLQDQARRITATLPQRAKDLKLPTAPRLTTLSIFNGIGCHLYAAHYNKLLTSTDELHINDWDTDATSVTKHHFPNARTDMLPVDAMQITEAHIKAFKRIDLFLASPPCTDLSPVKLNKRTGEDHRKGFDGPTGCLFRKTIEIRGGSRSTTHSAKL